MNKSVAIVFLGDYRFDARCVNMLNTLIFKKIRVTIYHAGDKKYKTQMNSSSLLREVSLSPSKNKFKKYIHWCGLILRELRSQNMPDVILAADIYSLLPVCLYFSSNKIIYDSREIYSELSAHYKSPMKKKILKFVECVCIKRVSVILTTAKSDERYLKKIYKTSSHIKYKIIYNFPRNVFLNKKSNYLRSHFNISSNKIILLYQGVLQDGRGILQLFKIIKGTKNFVGIIIGDGEKKASYKRLVKQYQLNNQIYFLSKLPYMDLLEITSSADIGLALIKPISISYKYALPNKLFEYAISGIPCLASNLPNMEYYINRFSLGKTASPYNVAEQIQAIDKLALYNKNLYILNNVKIKSLSWKAQEELFFQLVSSV